MFVACGIWCLADVSSVSPSSEQTGSSFNLESKLCDVTFESNAYRTKWREKTI